MSQYFKTCGVIESKLPNLELGTKEINCLVNKHFQLSFGTFSPFFVVSIIGPSPNSLIVSLVHNSNLYPVLILKVTV